MGRTRLSISMPVSQSHPLGLGVSLCDQQGGLVKGGGLFPSHRCVCVWGEVSTWSSRSPGVTRAGTAARGDSGVSGRQTLFPKKYPRAGIPKCENYLVMRILRKCHESQSKSHSASLLLSSFSLPGRKGPCFFEAVSPLFQHLLIYISLNAFCRQLYVQFDKNFCFRFVDFWQLPLIHGGMLASDYSILEKLKKE